jgi:outer membrane biosynthesis protein TonB
MAALAEDSLHEAPAWRRWAPRVALALAVALLVAALAWWLRSIAADTAAPKRQVARVVLLPDTPPPPPPPPPPKEEPQKPPPPKPEARPEPRPDEPPPEAPPPEAPIRMEGAAGDAPSPFAAGPVRNEYEAGAPVIGGTGGSRSPTAALDRAQDRLYVGSVRGLLQQAIEQALAPGTLQATAEFTLWLEADGRIQRVDLVPTGDPGLDTALRSALDATQRSLRLPAPPQALAPMRFRLNVRPAG